ncbi:MAG TPA: formate dehydrogenase accessory sulfurtransferase FdhD [Actinomycetales bacterium]|nr:formate dehydrogenase accessory sulfurtransferase FdhD [Actinomycetales bacterium]
MTVRRPMRRVVLDADTHRSLSRPDTLAVEEPLEIRVGGEPVVVTMRTPGDDLDLAFGFLLAEGLLQDPNHVSTGMHCTDTGPDGRPTFNVLELTLTPDATLKDVAGRRTFGMTSACGVCGSATIDAVEDRAASDLSDDRTTVRADVLLGLPDVLRDGQSVFDRTGGLHAAGLFTAGGELVALREDVGRHNAVDKVLGHAAREIGWPLTGHVLMVSGRASFELAQKAWMAGVPVLAAVSAPSSLAVDLAERAGMTLVGFLRPPSMNVYTGDHRVLVD